MANCNRIRLRVDWVNAPVGVSDEIQCRVALIDSEQSGGLTVNYYGGDKFLVLTSPDFPYDFEPYIEGVYDDYFVITAKYIPGMYLGWFINTDTLYIDGSLIDEVSTANYMLTLPNNNNSEPENLEDNETR